MDDSRRRFFKIAGAGVAGLPAAGVAAPARRSAEKPGANENLIFFSRAEAQFVSAVADTFIPADEFSPSGSALGIVVFIDRQLAGAYGVNGRKYFAGPFLPGTPEQGNQSPLAPADLYRLAIPEVDAWCAANRGKPFAELAAVDRNSVLHSMRENRMQLPNAPARQFLSLIYNDCVEGFFADPIYGGNRGKASWKMLGYHGPFRNYAQDIAKYRFKRYVAAPRGIADLTQT